MTAIARAYAAGLKCYNKCVSSHTYGLGHRAPEIENAFAKGYADAKAKKVAQ